MPHFTEHNHPDYDDQKRNWDYAWDHYTGEYVSHRKIGEYLERKQQRETEKAYQERQDLADPVLYFPEAVDSLNGIVATNEDKVSREWGELGDPEEPDSIAYTLKRNADGNGMNWGPLFKQVGIRQTVMHRVWGIVEGVKTEEMENGETRTLEEAKVKIINPQAVVNWYPTEGNLRQVLVKEGGDHRESIKDEAGGEDVYVLYTLEGWTRFRMEEYEQKGGGTGYRPVEMGSGDYEYYADTDRKVRILPIFPVEIPMPRAVGYLLARKQNHIFNKKSRRDHGIMNMSFALLRMVATDDQYQDLVSNIEDGYNIIRQEPDSGGEHGYMSPDSTYLTEYGEILERDKSDFYSAAFKQYADSAKQVSATEIRLESRSGIEAFLALLVTSIDEFENACLWRLEQVYFAGEPARWGQASVERSKKFQPEDIKEAFNKLSGAVLNADRAEAMSTREKVRTLHPEWSDEDVEDEVERIQKEKGAQPVPTGMMGD